MKDIELPKTVNGMELVKTTYNELLDYYTPEEIEEQYGKDVKLIYAYEAKDGSSVSSVVGVQRDDETLSIYGIRLDRENISEETFINMLTQL